MTETATEKEKRLRESHVKHAALAQFYRWWQDHDDKAIGLSHRLDVLDRDAVVSSDNGESTGHDDYAAAERQQPAHWQNAHFLRASTVDLQRNGAIAIRAEIEFLNVGIDPGGGVMKSTAYCNAVLRPTDTVLPKIAEIRIARGDLQPADEFKPAYAENRVRSLIHYFTALVESPGRDPEPFQELLADEFGLHYIDPPIDSFAALGAWVAGPLSSVVASNHVVGNVSLQRLDDCSYSATIDMRSEAMFPDGSGIASRNTQNWSITDDTSERFARLRKITIRRDEIRRF